MKSVLGNVENVSAFGQIWVKFTPEWKKKTERSLATVIFIARGPLLEYWMNEIHILIVVDCIVFMRDFIQYTIQEYVELCSVMKNVIYSNYTDPKPSLSSKQLYKYHLNILVKKCFNKNRDVLY